MCVTAGVTVAKTVNDGCVSPVSQCDTCHLADCHVGVKCNENTNDI